jgi:hypothetical protein
MHSNAMVGLSDEQTDRLRSLREEVAEFDRAIAAAEAGRVRVLARAAGLVDEVTTDIPARVRQSDMVLRSVAAELAVAARVSDRSMQRQIGDAATLATDYPATLAAWEAGDITRGHVRAVQDAGVILPSGDRAEFDLAAVELCTEDSPGRVSPRLQALAEQLHPITMQERHDAAHATRCVKVLRGVDGMSTLMVPTSSLMADAVYDRLTQQARVIVDARTNPPAGLDDATLAAFTTDNRTMDQVRADLVVDMLLTSAPTTDPTRTDDGPGTLGAIRAKVQIVVPVLTLIGASEEPATLVGHGPVDPDTARRLACATPGPWERVLTHPITGVVLHTDTYQRTNAIDRHLRARDRHCRFPGCRIPAIRCEVDHTIDYARGGPTDVGNLAYLCQRHHSMKQFTAWRVRQLEGGVLEWTSPLGRTYIDQPPSLGVHFRPTVDDGEHEPPRDPDPPGNPGPPDDGPIRGVELPGDPGHDAPF